MLGKTMEKRPCAKGCGKLVDPRGAHRHEVKCSGKPGPPAGVVRKKARAQTPRKSAAPCFFCHSETSALARDLLGRMIRGGMAVDAAVALTVEVVPLVSRHPKFEKSP